MSEAAMIGISLAQGVGTLIIASFVAYVAYQQWQTNQASVQERLFDRRIEVFKKTQKLLSKIKVKDHVTADDIGEFLEARQLAHFIFDEAISSYLQEILDCCWRLLSYAKNLEKFPSSDRVEDWVEGRNHEIEWIEQQLLVFFDKFRPQLSFERYKL